MNRTYQTYKPHKTYSYLTRRRAMIVISLLLLALLGFAIAALSLGSEHVASRSLFPALISKLTGTVSPLSSEQDVIIFSLRLPRIALAIGVGAALAVAGSAYQAARRSVRSPRSFSRPNFHTAFRTSGRCSDSQGRRSSPWLFTAWGDA